MKASRITRKLTTLFIVLTLFVSILPASTAKAQSADMVFKAAADTYVDSSLPTNTRGSNPKLSIDGAPVIISYVRFSVSGVNGGTVNAAKLRFYVVDDSHSGFDVAQVSNTSWPESGMTWKTRPSVGNVIASSGGYGVNRWIEIDISGNVTADGQYAFALVSSADTTTALASRQTTNAPQLVLTVDGAAAAPTAVPTSAPTAPTAAPTTAPTTAPSTPSAFNLDAVADATVRSAAASTNYGKEANLNVDVSPAIRSYMRFNVPAFNGSITSAKLRFVVTDASASGFSVAKVSNTSWSETGITYSNAPSVGSTLKTTGPLSNGATIDLDVTGAVTAPGLVSFAMVTPYDTTMAVAAREAGAKGPKLVLTTSGSGPAPTAVPTTVPTTSPTVVPTAAPTQTGAVKPLGVSGTWNLKFSDDFNGSSLDLNKWEPNWLAGNDTAITKPINGRELGCYDPAQVSLTGGNLKLSAVARSCRANNGVTYRYASGIVTSRPHYTFTYGYMESRVWLDGTDSIKNWPAFWADGTGQWPTTGEIDVFEGLGGRASWHFHYGTPSDHKSAGGYPSITPKAGWHTFGADWGPGVVKFYYDGVYVGQTTSGVTSSPMFLILNYGLSEYISPPVQVPSHFLVDYVRVWQH